MKLLRAALVLFFAAPGAAVASPASLLARDLPARSGVSVEAPQRFDLVGLHWQGSGGIRFRTRSESGRWSAWRAAAPESDDLPDQNTAESRRSRGWHLGSPYWVGASDRIQYRLSGSVRRVRAFFVHSALQARTPPRAQPFEANAPAIITRQQWGAIESIRRNRKRGPVYADGVHLAIVHHTAGSNAYTRSQSAAIVRGIELYHVKGNGWDDIGYNFLVDKYGQVFEGRWGGMERPVVGAHALGFNYGSVGVALLGNYNGAGLTAAARAALVKLIAWRLDLSHVDPLSRVTRVSTGNPRYHQGTSVQLRAVSGHRDTYPTSCPGNNVYAQLPSVTRQIGLTGLPKIYSPIVFGALGGSVRFTAKLSGSARWTVTVTDALGTKVASGTGVGRAVDWTWDASLVPRGRYMYSIDATAGGSTARPATGTIGGAGLPQLSVSQLRVRPSVVSPNGDGIGDTALITYFLGASAQLTVTLADGIGAPLATLYAGAMNQGAHSFAWRQVAVPDGIYRITISAQGTSGKQVSQTTTFYVDRNLVGVKAVPLVISPNGDGLFDETVVSFGLVAPAVARVEVWQSGRRLASLFGQTLQAGPLEQKWDGRIGGKVARDGKYDLVVRTTDPITTVTETRTVTVDTTAPRVRLVSLRRMQFWISEAATVTASFGRRRVSKAVKPGYFSFPLFRGRVAHFGLTATDRVGNRSARLRG
jgi:N-acetylmuramoyl-L-alanine amidase